MEKPVRSNRKDKKIPSKLCVRCGAVLPQNEFYNNRGWATQSFHDAWCKKCCASFCVDKEYAAESAAGTMIRDESGEFHDDGEMILSREWNGMYTQREIDYLNDYYARLEEGFVLIGDLEHTIRAVGMDSNPL